MTYNNQFISGNTDGTPITVLRRDVAEQIHNDDDSNYSIDTIKTTTEMKELVNEINNDIKNKKKQKKEKTTKDVNNDTKINTKKSTIVEDSIYDGILLLIIYLLMSQEFVKNFLGIYVNVINANSDGVVPFLGILTYGFIFVVVFLSIRYVIHIVS